MPQVLRNFNSSRRIISIFGVIILAQATSACALGSKSHDSASNGGANFASANPGSKSSLLQQSNMWAVKWQKNPTDPGIAINYARSLRAEGANQKAVQVLQQAALKAPKNQAVIAEFGKALSTAGQYKQAMQNLNRAQTLGRPDWRIYSAQGITLDKMQQYARARKHYKSALNLKPNQPSVLNNIGLSYALEGDLTKAETYLRRAATASGAQPKVKRNLALVLGLGGKFDQSAQASTGVLSAEDTSVNIAYIKTMLSQPGTWQKLSSKTRIAKSTPRKAKKRTVSSTRKITPIETKILTELKKTNKAAEHKVSTNGPLRINPVAAEQKTVSIDHPNLRTN